MISIVCEINCSHWHKNSYTVIALEPETKAQEQPASHHCSN